MTNPPIVVRYRQALADFWGARNERERKQLLLAAIVVVFGLTYMLLLEPAYLGGKQLQKSLPTLRQQAAEVPCHCKPRPWRVKSRRRRRP